MLDRPGLRWLRMHPTGMIAATAFAVLAMTPSLIPRGWTLTGESDRGANHQED